MKLVNPRFPELGVGIFDVNWKWEFREQDLEASQEAGKTIWKDEWHTVRINNSQLPIKLTDGIHITRHRVFAILDTPNSPWTPRYVPDLSKPAPIDAPLEGAALQIACYMARGSKTYHEVAQKIADRMFRVPHFAYDPNPNYTRLGSKPNMSYSSLKVPDSAGKNLAQFSLYKFVERFYGGNGLGEEVNCLDCAAAVVMFSNMLGCNLRLGKFQNQADIDATDEDHYMDNRFEINDIKAIGRQGQPIPGVNREDGNFFSYHTVAWSSASGLPTLPKHFCHPDNIIYDACVQFIVDGQEISGSGHQQGDACTPGTYVHYLAAPTDAGRPRCNPQEITVYDIQIVL